MAILQQQRQQQGGVGGAAAGGANPKLSPSHLGGGLSKQPVGDSLPHSGMGGALSDLHAKTQGMYSGRSNVQIIIHPSSIPALSKLGSQGSAERPGQSSRQPLTPTVNLD